MNISAVTGGVEQAVQHCMHLPLQRMPRSHLLLWSAAAELLEMAHADPDPNTHRNKLLESIKEQEVRPRVVLDHIMPFIALDDRQLAGGGHECQQIAADNNEACC